MTEFKPRSDTHNHLTRSRNQINKEKVKTTKMGTSSAKHSAINAYNSLPEFIKYYNKPKFKHEIKKISINKLSKL